MFILLFGDFYLCASFGENRSRNATVRVRTDGHIHTHTYIRTPGFVQILKKFGKYFANFQGLEKSEKMIIGMEKYGKILEKYGKLQSHCCTNPGTRTQNDFIICPISIAYS